MNAPKKHSPIRGFQVPSIRRPDYSSSLRYISILIHLLLLPSLCCEETTWPIYSEDFSHIVGYKNKPQFVIDRNGKERTSYDAMLAMWLNKKWEVSNSFPSNNDLVGAKQEIEPGLMQRVCYYSNAIKLKPFISLAKSENSKTIVGIGGVSYSFDNDLVIGVEMESGKFGLKTTLTDKLNKETDFDGEAKYNSIKLKVGSDRIGGFLSYKQLSAPNIDIFVNKVDGTIADIYYDDAYTSKMACIGLYGKFFSDNGWTLEFNNGLGVCMGTPGNDVSDLVNKQYNTSPKPYTGVGADFTIDLSYRQNIFSYGEWFIGVRGTAFGHIDAIGVSLEEGSKENPENKFEGELRASRIDLYYGPYIGFGLIF